MTKFVRCLGFAFLLASFLVESRPEAQSNWTEPLAPHTVIANIHYVGSQGLSSYLITTPAGHVLINSSLEKSVPLIQKSVESLGFRFSDIRMLLISHAHWDHCAGSSAIKSITGAKYCVMDSDVSVVETGGRTDFQYGELEGAHFPATKVDRVLHDKETVEFGGMVLTARKTPGHTKGCTTWTMRVWEKGAWHDVVIVGSPNVNPGYKLVNNDRYPEIARDYEITFKVLRSIPCEIFLGAHGDYYGMMAKLQKSPAGAKNPFADPAAYSSYIDDREKAFLRELKKQRQ